jgi:transcriptional regulator with XRE-family HTH domain
MSAFHVSIAYMLFCPRPRTTGELIREARKLRGWSVPELAERLELATQTVYRWEWGAVAVSEKKQQKLCLVLNIPIGSLRARTGQAA